MTMRSAVTLIGALAWGSPLLAQEPHPQARATWVRPVAHWGKWLTAAAAVGFTVLGAREHSRSAESWDRLLRICRNDNADCTIATDGTYTNPVAEANYQRSLYYDGRARSRLVAGQVAIVVSAVLFIYDLKRGTNGPPNIPFDPNKLLVSPALGGGTNVGLQLQF